MLIMAYKNGNLLNLWMHASILSLSFSDLASLKYFPFTIPSKILQWPADITILLGDRILRNSSLIRHPHEFLASMNRINDFNNTSFSSHSVVSIKELTSGGENFLTSRKLHFVFFGEPSEFVLLISKTFQSPLSPFHHSWCIVISDLDEKFTQVRSEWLMILRNLNLGIDSDVFIGIWRWNHVKVLEVYRICSKCPNTINEICLVFENQTIIGENCYSNKYERRKNLGSIHFNVVAVDTVPFLANFSLDTNGVLRVVGGLFGATFSILRKELNMTYTLKILHGYKYGTFRNNTWNGMIGYLTRGEADMTVSELSMAPDRLESIDYSTSFDTVGRKIYIRKILESKKINWKFYSAPFSSFLHFNVLFCIVLMMFLLWMVDLLQKGTNNYETLTLGESFWIAFSSICQKGSHRVPTSRSSKIIFFAFSLTFLTIFCAYSATLISQLAATPPVTVPFRDLQDFVNKGKNWKGGPIKGDLMQIYMEKTCPDLLKNTNTGRNLQCELLVRLWTKVVEAEKETLPTDFQGGLKRVLKEKFAFIAASAGTRFRIANDFKERDACNILEMEGDYISSNLAFGLRKNNPYKKLVNYKLLQLRKSGVLKRLQKSWLPQRLQCVDHNPSGFNDATIYDVGSLPIIWILGLLISFFILVVELLICRNM